MRPILGLNPCAEYGPAKRWPIERFVAAAREIQKRTNCAWLIFGSKNDAPITNQIASVPNSELRTPNSEIWPARLRSAN